MGVGISLSVSVGMPASMLKVAIILQRERHFNRHVVVSYAGHMGINEAPPPAAFSVRRNDSLPALAFAAGVVPGAPQIDVVCGAGVEVSESNVIAGAWAGDFGQLGMDRAATSVGTGLALTAEGLVGLVGTASASALSSLCSISPRRLARTASTRAVP